MPYPNGIQVDGNRSRKSNLGGRKPKAFAQTGETTDSHSGEIVNGSSVPGQTVTEALDHLATVVSGGLSTAKYAVPGPAAENAFTVPTTFVAGKVKVYQQRQRLALTDDYTEAAAGANTLITTIVPVTAGETMIFDY